MKLSFRDKVLITTSIALICFTAKAEEKSPHQVKLGLEIERYQYKEPKGMTKVGPFPGISLKGYYQELISVISILRRTGQRG